MKKVFLQLRRIKEKLWFRPVIFALASVAAALLAQLADGFRSTEWMPDLERDSLVDLLETLANSMLVISIFAVASMLSAFSAASSTATPRSFQLIAADDLSQNALSVFIGSFIYGVVAGVSLKNGFYGNAGLFTLFVMTLAVFALVILTFLRWVERISRLGRLDYTIEKVEQAAVKALAHRYCHPLMDGVPCSSHNHLQEVYSRETGYVQAIDMDRLQKASAQSGAIVVLNCAPGTYATPDRPIAFIASNSSQEKDRDTVCSAVTIGRTRRYDDDPRFGLIALSEIGSRALSPGINDPGTAIAIIGSLVRTFTSVLTLPPAQISSEVRYPGVEVPTLRMDDLFEDAFRALSRDGAGNIEVMIRLQKAYRSLASLPHPEVQRLAAHYSASSLRRAAEEITFADDLTELQKLSL